MAEDVPSSDGTAAIPKDWNIALIMIDAMRADTLYPSRTSSPPRDHARDGDTPFLDSLIDKMIRFENAYSPSNVTHLSIPSIFTGLNAESYRHRVADPLSVRMKRAGRTPIAVITPTFAKAQNKFKPLRDGFEQLTTYDESDQHQTVPKMLEAVDNAKQPFFGWFHFYALHNPYFAEKRPAAGFPAIPCAISQRPALVGW